MPRIALVTYDPGPQPSRDTDLPVLADALTAAGADARAVAWDDPDADWAASTSPSCAPPGTTAGGLRSSRPGWSAAPG